MCGPLSDRFGRKPALMGFVFLHIISGVLALFVNSFWTFLVSRVAHVSIGNAICYVSFIWALEMVGKEKRFLAGMVMELGFASGCLFLSVVAYFIRDWRILFATISAPSVLFISLCWLIQESPRWLHQQNHTNKALAILINIADVNESSCDRGTLVSLLNAETPGNVVSSKKNPISGLFR